eukprot:165806-Chlamydomonas_euryale.AAC.5
MVMSVGTSTVCAALPIPLRLCDERLAFPSIARRRPRKTWMTGSVAEDSDGQECTSGSLVNPLSHNQARMELLNILVSSRTSLMQHS